MKNLIAKLKLDYPKLTFSLGPSHCWSPDNSHIYYALNLNDPHGVEGLLHEVGHAILDHQGYQSDLELLKKEVAAWSAAEKLAVTYKVTLDQNHVQSCVDTYRDWLYKRSKCPKCQGTGAQQSEEIYACLNCKQQWHVTASRFCRPYRQIKKSQT